MLTKNIPEMERRTLEHIKADRVIQGDYWGTYDSEGNFIDHKDGEITEDSKGCFIGCITHSEFAQRVTDEFGIPVKLVRTLENIFEMQTHADSIKFFGAIPKSIGVDGKYLGGVEKEFYFFRGVTAKEKAKFILKLLKEAPMGVQNAD